MVNRVLPEFQKFLLSRGFVSENKVSFYAYWVSKFLAFSNSNEGLGVDLCVDKFLDEIHSHNKFADWKIQQAKEAIQLYIKHFLNGDIAVLTNSSDAGKIVTIPEIINKLRDALRLKHYADRTERSYIDWAKRFFVYLSEVKQKNADIQKLNSIDMRDFLSFLAVRQRVSSSTQNQAFNALLFLFRDILKKNVQDLDKTVRAKRGAKLPVVLAQDEIQKLFECIKGRNLLILQLLYGAGLRLMELVRLRVQDIDFESNLIFIRSGKGDKDRSTMLPEMVKENLRSYLEEVRSLHEKDIKAGYGEVYLPDSLEYKYPSAGKEWRWQYVFPSLTLSVDPRSGKIRRHHISAKAIQVTVQNAVKKAGIIKHATVHTLRHSFATHLLMNGVNIREIQELLGHKNVETTMVYTHVLRDMSNAPKSPLDTLYTGMHNTKRE